MSLRTWGNKDVKSGTRVFLRVDANVPVVKGQAKDGGPLGRIAQAMPEITRLRKRGAKIILASHLGEPGGKVNKKLSLLPVAKLFAKHLKINVPLVQPGDTLNQKPGDVCLLENLRFNPGEEANADAFAWQLAKLADVYVNNAFGVCHRRHASVHAITRHLPSFAGELLLREVEALSAKLDKPFMLVMGGAKIATKVAVLKHLGPKADKILLGGGLGVTFLAAADVELPAYPAALMVDADVSLARKLSRSFAKKLVLPVDLIAKPKEHLVYDVGPETTALFRQTLKSAKTVIWNGPLGIIEKKDGQTGTLDLARTLNKSTARTVTGGGDTIEFLQEHHLLKGFSHVSTGGGAMLAFLGGESLPGLEALRA